MNFVRKTAVRFVIAGMLLGTPAAVLANTDSESGDDSGADGWRGLLMNLVYQGVSAFIDSGGCNADQNPQG